MASIPVGTKKNIPESAVMIFSYVFFTLFTFSCAYPFYYLIINTLSANNLSGRGEIIFYPKGVHFNNYRNIFTYEGIPGAAFISLARTVIGSALTVLGSSYLGFMFTNKKLWARTFWYRFVVATMYFSAGLIPWYLIMMNLRLTNNFLAYIIPSIVQPFNIILIKTYIESTPVELQEAAEIDGAGIFYIFGRIILPISKPILATVGIFVAVGQWNSFMDTLLLVTNPKLFSLQFMLYRFLKEARSLAS
jgi:putative aldouronate transport system permease protein